MRVTVIGGTGLIGTRLVRRLRAQGHDVVAAAGGTGVNSYTEEGLEDALEGASTVVDVSNSSCTDDVARAVADAALGDPTRRITEHAGPEVLGLRELARLHLRYLQDERDVLPDPLGTYFGAHLASDDLLPSATAHLASTTYHDWRTDPASSEAARRLLAE